MCNRHVAIQKCNLVPNCVVAGNLISLAYGNAI